MAAPLHCLTGQGPPRSVHGTGLVVQAGDPALATLGGPVQGDVCRPPGLPSCLEEGLPSVLLRSLGGEFLVTPVTYLSPGEGKRHTLSHGHHPTPK